MVMKFCGTLPVIFNDLWCEADRKYCHSDSVSVILKPENLVVFLSNSGSLMRLLEC